MAIASDAFDAYQSLADGQFGFDDITGIGNVGMDMLSAVLDPVGALIAAPLGELLNLIVHHVKFISEPLAKLEGSPELVKAQAEAWNQVAAEYVTAGNEHASGAGDLPSWTGPASQTYHEVYKAINGIFQAAASGADKMSNSVVAAGSVVALVRDFIWDMITQLLTKAIEGAIAALAVAVPTVGASLAAFAGWYTANVGAIAIKITKVLTNLLQRAQKVVAKLHINTKALEKAITKCKDMTKQLESAQKRAGRIPSAAKGLPASERKNQIPAGNLPGDTTVPGRAGGRPPKTGPIKDPTPDNLGDQIKDSLPSVGDLYDGYKNGYQNAQNDDQKPVTTVK